MASGPSSADPRTSPDHAAERDVRPVVARPRAGVPGAAIAVAAVAAGALLFAVLDSRRRSLQAPATFPDGRIGSESAAPPPLYVPPQLAPAPAPAPVPPPPAPAPTQNFERPPSVVYVPQPPPPAEPPAPPPRIDSSPALVVDKGAMPQAIEEAAGASGAAPSANGPAEAAGRRRAAMFASPATTVPQGTLIHAVLETGFDSTRPGFARALVQRDVHGFDGSRVLIPRGSRLIGEYSGAVQGQKRALILWTRLVRPDGVTIAIGSPATDPLGRGGVRARVDSHFFERFAGAILQSVLDIGVNLAARSTDVPVVIALPGAVQGSTAAIARPADIPPTLKVRPGTSISVFVARDLDFTGAEARR